MVSQQEHFTNKETCFLIENLLLQETVFYLGNYSNYFSFSDTSLIQLQEQFPGKGTQLKLNIPAKFLKLQKNDFINN